MKNSIKPEYQTLIKLSHMVTNASEGFRMVRFKNMAFKTFIKALKVKRDEFVLPF